MNTLVQQKQQIQVLDTECSMLRNMVRNLSKGSHSAAFNYRMSVNSAQEDLEEEDTLHQTMEDMDLGSQDSHPTNIGQHEAISKCLSIVSMFCKSILILGVSFKVYTSRNFLKATAKVDLEILFLAYSVRLLCWSYFMAAFLMYLFAVQRSCSTL
jgi:hypothetical protein